MPATPQRCRQATTEVGSESDRSRIKSRITVALCGLSILLIRLSYLIKDNYI